MSERNFFKQIARKAIVPLAALGIMHAATSSKEAHADPMKRLNFRDEPMDISAEPTITPDSLAAQAAQAAQDQSTRKIQIESKGPSLSVDSSLVPSVKIEGIRRINPEAQAPVVHPDNGQ